MKDDLRNVLKVSRKTFFNPYAWLSVDTIVDSHDTISTLVKGAMTKPVAGEPETFDEAMKRQGLSENDVIEGGKTYRRIAFMFLLLGLSSAAYGIFLVVTYMTITGFVLALACSALFLSQAFKYDFWSLQMRSRRLGLTFADWKHYYLGSKG